MDRIENIIRPVAVDFQKFGREFQKALQTDNVLLREVLTWATSRRGKQLRPLLVLLSAQLAYGINDKTHQAAVALELLHTASLVHDDVVDNSPLRRGIDSVQAHWNNKVAVLAGDYLLSKSMSIVAGLRNVQMLNILSDLGRTLTSGELLQLHQKEGMWITEDEYFRMIEQKTACLFASCAAMGAVSAGATMRQQSAITAYGKHLGLCFQLKDDELDYSDTEDLGKPTMNDIRDGKVTLPLLISLQRAGREEAQAMRELVAGELNFEKENEIKSFVLRYDGLRYTRRKMEEYRQMAMESLSAFRPSSTTEALQLLLDYAIARQY
ncbi:MAG: polyprenyl synthetase family protein [Paludibacter sp.]|nr:polyprenyl synthetase family protein [Bacteroidales bacterium]MCM1068392.1 polyprenyl synthetase family protein [Prevotella sp.]MCM1354752.1 polyprenyl synthetase family protein [Bacteroides sp.]MCM1442161.1 polyprenyl synthetase family protein [Muribaculum sp.]MCM1482416.1 polyprenyl synthetase family protein [Paludibacter sp.]